MNSAPRKRRHWFWKENISNNKSSDFKYQQQENILIKNICELLMAPLIHFPVATGLGMENSNTYESGPALPEGLWRWVWKDHGAQC